MPHDVSVAVHPVTGQALAYVAYWDLGVVILDISDPARPVKVGQARDFGPAPYGDIHMARASEALIGGKVVLVAEPELDGQEDSGYLTFFDVTDPAHPQYVSSWRLPGNLTTAGTGGPHYFDFREGRVALSHYHAGFWVIDVHDAHNLAQPRTVAFAEVNATGPAYPATPRHHVGGFGPAPSAWDAWWLDGTHLAGTDLHAGLAIYEFTGPTPSIDEPYTGDS